MAYTRKQIVDAILKAERIALREYMLAHAKEQNFPQKFIKDNEESLDSACADIITDELAEKLLPQARMVIAMRKEREKVLEQSALGRLHAAIEDCLFQSQMSERLNMTDMNLGESQQDWKQFCVALTSGNALATLEALNLLLATASYEVIVLELPPLPPRYQILE